jgi:GNAT superfamily N-acetyltransferase
VIRPARIDDAEVLAALQVRAWHAAYDAYVAPESIDAAAEDRVARWREILGADGDGATFVDDRDGGGLTGFVSVGPGRHEADPSGAGELRALYVEPGLVGTGRGRALLVTGEGWLAERFADAFLWVLEPNTGARRFYERHGWREDAEPYDRDRWGWSPSVRYRKALR